MTGVKIEINDLTKRIGGQTVLEQISLEMRSGRVYGLQGINGSGKTMLMRAIIGLIRPSGGTIRINGRLLGKDMEFPDSIGFLLENPAFLDRYSGKENLKLLTAIDRQAPDEQIESMLTKVGLDPHDCKKYRKYSLGMKQRLGLAAAVLEAPDIVILDEPSNALDESGVAMLKNLVAEEKQRGALVILSCHDRGMLEEMTDIIFRMDAGRIIERIEIQTEEDADGEA